MNGQFVVQIGFPYKEDQNNVDSRHAIVFQIGGIPSYGKGTTSVLHTDLSDGLVSP